MKRLLEHANQAFGGEKATADAEDKIKVLHAKIDQLTMENDFLEQGLTKIHGPRSKGW